MPTERLRPTEIDPQILTAYAATFISRRDLYPIQLPNGTYISVYKELTDSMVAAHLKGYITIGAYALDRSGWSKWVCFDADDNVGWQGLLNMASGLTRRDLSPYLEPSRRGGHLWLFTDPIPGFQTRRFAKQLLSEYKLPLAKKGVSSIEIYPKQDKPKDGPGSCVRLPLGIHKLTGKRYHFIDLNGDPIAPTVRDQLAILSHPQRVPQSFIDDVLAQAPEHTPLSPSPSFETKKHETTGAHKVSERLIATIPVYEFVSQFVELDDRGKGYCPFHEDQVKSFQVNRPANYWHCYAGCGGGNLIHFWMKWREKQGQVDSFKATIKDLADKLLPY
jgi:hypothetical protein